MKTVAINEFAKRQLNKSQWTHIPSIEKFEEIRKLTEEKINNNDFSDGYAPFCKLITLVVSEINSTIAKISDDNKHLLVTKLTKRREGEEEYETTFFPEGTVEPLPSKYITVIVYSKEQMEKEYKEFHGDTLTGSDWDIVSVNSEPYEGTAPMSPITMIRNASGKGGSGHQYTLEELEISKDFWSKHALVGNI
ncbi:DUF3228 family protein [bacterium]|jgi:hypothetical protein|nr:DUF3228 family protein [bacterium]